MEFLDKTTNSGLSLHFLSVCLIRAARPVIPDPPQGLTHWLCDLEHVP